MTNYDGTDDFEGVVTADQLNKTVVWRGTALPIGVTNKIPQNGMFMLVDSLSAPTTSDFYLQTSATLSSPSFTLIPAADVFSTYSIVFKDTDSSRYTTNLKFDQGNNFTYTGTTTKAAVSVADDGINGGAGAKLNDTITRWGCSIKAAADGMVFNDISWRSDSSNATVGSPTGNVYYRHYDSDESTVLYERLLGDASDFVPNNSNWSHYVDERTINTGDVLALVYEDGDASNYIQLGDYGATGVYHFLQSWNGSAWSGVSALESGYFRLRLVYEAGVAGSDTTGHWESTSEVNPTLSIDMLAARNVGGVLLNVDSSNTVTTADIQYSDDNTTYTTLGSITFADYTDEVDTPITWKFISHRYWRIKGTDGGSKVMALRKFLFGSPADIGLDHTHALPDLP